MDRFPPFVEDLPEIDFPFEGVSGHLLQGEQQQVAFVHFAARTDVPPHRHRAQWEIVVAGELHLTVDGETRTHRPGETFYIPAWVEHGAVVEAGYQAIIIFDQPDRYATK
ncbi:MAG: cupin domain-containing protein [Candidatus Eiseniibacteriota bacterium]|jgi:quercetin dioxygenase-like cupin family protein